MINTEIIKIASDTSNCGIKKKSNIENLREDVNEINTIHKNKKIILKRKYKPFRKLFQQKYKERFQCILLPFNALLKVVNIVT